MWWTLLADVSCHFEIRQVPNSLTMEALLRLSYSSLKVVNRQADQESMLPCIPSKLFVAAFLAFLSFAGMRMREVLFALAQLIEHVLRMYCMVVGLA